MKAKLQQVYATFKEMYGVSFHSWDMTHDIARYPVIWEGDFGLFQEYQLWKSLIPIFKQHGVAYYQGIDDFVKHYGHWLYDKYNKIQNK